MGTPSPNIIQGDGRTQEFLLHIHFLDNRGGKILQLVLWMGKTKKNRSQISHTSKMTRATTTRQDTPRSSATLTRLPPTPVGREIPTDTAWEKEIHMDMVWVNGSHMATG